MGAIGNSISRNCKTDKVLKVMESGENTKAGLMVKTKSGLMGRTYSNEVPINGKIRVYTDKGRFLCDPETLKIKGFID